MTDNNIFNLLHHWGLPTAFAAAMAGDGDQAKVRSAFATALLPTTNTVAASGTAQTLPDISASGQHLITLTGACTFTFPAAAAGKQFTLVTIQDATGTRLVTWPASVKWPGGTAPTLSTAATKKDAFSFICVDGTTWLGRTYGLDMR